MRQRGTADVSVDNAGVTFPSTIQQYKFYQQEGVTLADMIVRLASKPFIPLTLGARRDGGCRRESFVPSCKARD